MFYKDKTTKLYFSRFIILSYTSQVINKTTYTRWCFTEDTTGPTQERPGKPGRSFFMKLIEYYFDYSFVNFLVILVPAASTVMM